MTLEEIARDFELYAAALKKKWTGREQWLSEKEEDKQSRFAALKGEPEESKSDIRAEQDESLPEPEASSIPVVADPTSQPCLAP